MAKIKPRWKPGQSGNPSGRPKVPVEVRDLARAHTTEAIAALARTLKDKRAPHAAKVAAANAILDRGYGKPTQPIEGSLTLFDKMTDAEQRAIAIALATLGGDAGGIEGLVAGDADSAAGGAETTH